MSRRHKAVVDLTRTSLRQLRVGFAWCECGRALELRDEFWRHTPTKRHAA